MRAIRLSRRPSPPPGTENRWETLKAHAKARWAALSDADIDGVRGNADRLADALQARYGYSHGDALREILSWSQSLRSGGTH